MDGDPFETVAIAYSPPQAGVILSLFAWHGIPAYGQNIETVSANCPLTLALGGIPIRVLREFADEARDLLSEAAGDDEREAPLLTPGHRVAAIGLLVLLGLLAAPPPPRLGAEIVR
ncbi:MAG: hypothetical protein EOP61_10985 [Sphingomonadales bacterium]|nr:MAG: hypothetical protein EOP61_10985 [Sphingomonadales bacterium]